MLYSGFILEEIHSNFSPVNCILLKHGINQMNILIIKKLMILQLYAQSLYCPPDVWGGRGTDGNLKFMVPFVP